MMQWLIIMAELSPLLIWTMIYGVVIVLYFFKDHGGIMVVTVPTLMQGMSFSTPLEG